MKRILLFAILLLPHIASAQGFGGSGCPRWLSLFSESGGTLTLSGDMVAASYTATATAGQNAIAVQNTGARVDYGAGASDHASSDGTTVTFAGPLATSSNLVVSGNLRASTAYPSSSSYPFVLKGNRAVGSGPSVIAGSNDPQTTATVNIFGVSPSDAVDGSDATFLVNAAGMPRIGIGNTTATPTCDATERGRIWVVEGGAGVTDTVSMCLKAAADTYSWITITTGG